MTYGYIVFGNTSFISHFQTRKGRPAQTGVLRRCQRKIKYWHAVQGMGLRKVSYVAFIFSVFSRNQEKMKATDLAVSQLQGSTICPCARPAHVSKGGPGPEFKFSKTVEVGWSC